MDWESGFSPTIIDELHSWDIQGDQKVGARGVTQSIIEEVHSSISFYGYATRSNGR